MDTDVVVGLKDIDRTLVAMVGGKGAHLGELSRVDGIRVPPGFCVTTDAFRRATADLPSFDDQRDHLSRLNADDREAIAVVSAEVRDLIEGISVPDELASAITDSLAALGDENAYAIRSSATAEDMPTASFAGQQDTYLNVVGPAEILRHINKCWASLFTERAVTYRMRNGFDHRTVSMGVVVQQMVFAHAAGIMFTAEPVSGNRQVVAVEASFGLGEALVSGLVNPDSYAVRDGEIADTTIATKQLAIDALPGGGTKEQAVGAGRQDQPALTDAQVVRLAQLGRRIEAHFGSPQDIEWCLVDDDFQFVQSRPITTLFPVPQVDDGDNHVYLSVGHQQMMTEALKPLGLSMWQLTAFRPMYVAGGRLFVDVTQELASSSTRDAIVGGFGKSDPLSGDALRTIAERAGFLPSLPVDASSGPPPVGLPVGGAPSPIETDLSVVTELIDRSEASIVALTRHLEAMSGEAVFEFILDDIPEMKRIIFDPQSRQVVMGGMEATWWLNDHLEEWLGEKNAADTLTQSVPHNVTAEMGLALLDVADAIRPHPEVVAFLEGLDDVEGDGFLDEMATLDGGPGSRDAIVSFLDTYGMRCVGEIDITRPRWSERPGMLVPVLRGNVRNFGPGAGAQRFEQGRQEALAKEQEVLERLQALPDGEQKADETKRMIDRARTFNGYREYPKYSMISRYFVYKQALLREAERLVQVGVIRDKEDAFYLTFQELHDVARGGHADEQLIAERMAAFTSFQSLRPPRVFTSDGEAIAGSYRRDDVPEGALVGVPVSVGTVEGRARVIHDMAEADVDSGDILVTASTDPSWSPLFVSIAGLVTEVGGLMTHGAVIAREYGLPAVVGVEHATELIQDGQRIRVNGTNGHVEIFP